jgi:alanyl-tRNA synthetase
MTKHMYYEDSYLTEFSATVLETLTVGGKPAVVLDQTAFYPTSGGQPCDTGSLGGVRVAGVEEDAAGRIIHILDAPPAPGQVQGIVDWERRFDHMQQHTGQHILSQAFLGTAHAATLSFHLGQETSTIDLDLAQTDASILNATEDISARVIFENRSVHILNVTREELTSLGVRKESQRDGEIRVVDIEGFDRSPCGGTHVRRCGEIGSILILGSERYKGGTRVEFVCGGRALKAFRKDHETLKELGRLMSAHPHEIPKLADKILQERAGLLREKKHLEEQLLDLEAQDLLHQARKTEGAILVCRSYQDRKLEAVKVLAQKVAAAPGTAAVLFALQDAAQVVVARHPDLPGDCGAIVKQLTGRLGGRGGGKPELAQAGGIPLAAAEAWSQAIVDYFLSCRK